MPDRRLITFNSEGEYFAVPLGEVLEVIAVGIMVDVPGTRWPLTDLMIYRNDQVLPVFSLKGALGIEDSLEGRLIVVAQADEYLMGFRVEKIGGIITGYGDGDLENYEGEMKGQEGAILGTLIDSERKYTLLDLAHVIN
jgi:chemotaxis signal transduction protein